MYDVYAKNPEQRVQCMWPTQKINENNTENKTGKCIIRKVH